jgi:16S rRNA (cytosine967-C5)-methyltransferase
MNDVAPDRTDRRAHSLAVAAAAAMEAVLPAALRHARPADRELAAFLRGHREYGARDRRAIGDLVFAALRWWGWLEPLAPDLDGGAAPGPVRWQPLLLGALLAEQLDLPALKAALRTDLRLAAATADAQSAQPSERLAAVFAAAGAPAPACDPAALLPDWAAAEIESPRPLHELVEWLQRRPPLWLRVQAADPAAVRRELTAAGLEAEPHTRLADALRLPSRGAHMLSLAVYRERRVEVQDLASQCVARVCAPHPGERWWDACAGAGGKSLHLASLLAPGGEVLATDAEPERLAELRRRASYASLAGIHTATWEGGGRLPHGGGRFDGVLLDAPCTGSGVWRRNPWARWQTRAEDVGRFAARQETLLAAAAMGVKPGGVLVYATCSLFRRENSGVVESFLSARQEFRPEPFDHPIAGEVTQGWVQVWPWDGDCDAMFIARLRRRG